MKKLFYAVVALIIQQSSYNIQNSYAQAPNDNIGSGNCLSFDGNDFVDCGDIGDLGTTYTTEAWVNANPGTLGYIVSYRTNTTSTTTNIAISLAIVSGSVGFTVRDNSGTSANVSSPINDNQWYHVAAVRNGNNIELFVDGVSVGTNSASYGALIMNHLDIGCVYHDGANSHQTHINAQIDEVRIWNVARTQAQIRDNMCNTLEGNETGLVGYWNMNEGTGNTVGDLTTNANNGTRQ